MPEPTVNEDQLDELERLSREAQESIDNFEARRGEISYLEDQLATWCGEFTDKVTPQIVLALVAEVRAADKALYAAYDALCEGKREKAFGILEAAVAARTDKGKAGQKERP